jgi:hypothetical protein
MPDSQQMFTCKSVNGIWDKINFNVSVINPANRLEIDVRGRLDTGCNVTCLSERLIRTLALAPRERSWSVTSAGERSTLIYYATIVLPNSIVFPVMDVADFVQVKRDTSRTIKPVDDFDVLIGMDIITAGDLAISDDAGNTVVSFRRPHGGCIDFGL